MESLTITGENFYRHTTTSHVRPDKLSILRTEVKKVEGLEVEVPVALTSVLTMPWGAD